MRVKTFNTSGGEEETPEWLVKMVAQMGFQLQDVDGEPMQVETSTDQTQPYPLLSETDPLGMSEDYVPRTPPLESAPGQTQPYPLLSETDPLGMGEDYGHSRTGYVQDQLCHTQQNLRSFRLTREAFSPP